MENKLPFYMAYPVPLLYNDDRNARRDYDYMKSIYPDTAKRVLPYMEEECDRMEYDGSMMYDEYPDRLQLRLMCRRIYDKAEKEEENPGAWLMDLIEVMTYQELCRRRVNIERSVKKYIDLQEGLWKKTSTSPSCVLYCAVINECFQMKKSEHNIQEGTSWQIITLFLSECRQSGKVQLVW